MTEVQTERAFQKQEAIKKTPRKLIAKKGKKTQRYYKDIGLGFKTPRAAIEGKYIDKKCPFTSNISIRGRIVKGVVASTKMNRTIIIRKDYLHYISKYNRFEKRHKNVAAHCSPAFKLKEGDIVTLGECRPLSKTVRFNVIAHEPVAEGMQKKFVCF
eukprot:TRINITY_DN105_c0_g1_i1.p1 TRINITY_DN105_c0_g1~~TRINITY_DN105_c0_g1_i1.p1  ORF type:complete len:157 (-),score=39.08 TRINITY_DN105_c0_g1_i1:78-548(-)